MSKAMATPTIFPVPTCEAIAVERACKGLMPLCLLAFSCFPLFENSMRNAEVKTGDKFQTEGKKQAGSQKNKNKYRTHKITIQGPYKVVYATLIHREKRFISC